MRAIVISAATAGLALSAGIVPAAASRTASTPQCALHVSTLVAAPGEAIRVTGSGFPPAGTITIRDHASRNVILGVTQADQSGDFSLLAIIPETAPAGEHAIMATPGSYCSPAHFTVLVADSGRQPRRLSGVSPVGVEVVLTLGATAALIAWWLVRALVAGRRRKVST